MLNLAGSTHVVPIPTVPLPHTWKLFEIGLYNVASDAFNPIIDNHTSITSEYNRILSESIYAND